MPHLPLPTVVHVTALLTRRWRRPMLAGLSLTFAAAITLLPGPAAAAPDDGTVLILSTSVSGGASSPEALAAIGQGLSVDIATPDQWSALTAADFGAYRAIILGDPSCGGVGSAPFIGAAEATAHVWGPMIDGHVIVIGTDPVLHAKNDLTDMGVALAVSEPGKTGAYITLGCYYHGAAPGTPVPALAGISSLGGFTATGVDGCFDSAHIVAEHPALSGLTDAYLSNWGCAVHEAFDTWPADFIVFAIATTGGAYTASDGTIGTPYILVRGEAISVVSNVNLLAPATAQVGQTAALEATVDADGVPVTGATVTFTATAGPHLGLLGTATTDASGKAVLAMTGAAVGTDLIVASYVDAAGGTQTSGTASVVWGAAPVATPDPTPAPPVASDGPSAPLPTPSTDALNAPPSLTATHSAGPETDAATAVPSGRAAPEGGLPDTASPSPTARPYLLVMLLPLLLASVSGIAVRLAVRKRST